MQNFMQSATKKFYFLLIGGFFTFVLFTGMTFLIKPELQEPIPTTIEVTYVPFKIDDKPPIINKRPLPKKPEILQEPKKERSQIPRIQPKNLASLTDSGLHFSNVGIKVAINPSIGINPWGNHSGRGDELRPKVRISPTYPMKAARDNIEGFVTLSFDISEIGRPINIKIIETKPRGYFEKSAMKALKKWKFDPEIAKNSVRSQQVTLAFQLENDT